jgi:hypothetical protein
MATTAITIPTDPALTEHVAAIRQLGRQTVKNVIEIGRRLSECKKLVGHGNWGCWLDREFAWSERSALRFMQVFKLAKSKSDKLSFLELPVSALYLLAAAPETVREARDEIIERAEAGESVSVAEVKQTIETAKGRNLTRPKLYRAMKLGDDVVNQLKGTSLDNAREQDELVILNRGAPKGELTDVVKQLVAAAVAGEKVSAIAYTKNGAAFRGDDSAKPNGARALMASRQEPADSLDFFPTPPWATRALIERVLPVLCIRDLARMDAWEPACGEGHMAEVLTEYFGRVIATDLHDYGYGEAPVDFLDGATKRDADWCITNPPFDDKAIRFVLRALKLARVGVAMFVRLQWLETIERYEQVFRDHPPTLVAFFVERVNLCKGRWEPDGTTATAYCWLVWIHGEQPRPPLWIPPGCREHLTSVDDVARFTTHPVTRGISGAPPPADDGLDVPEFRTAP